MNILTFDIEEWFHIKFDDGFNNEQVFESMPSRIHQNMDFIFEALEKNNQKATFFCLGWVGRKYPEIIKKINNYGYQIGSHSDIHELATKQSIDVFRKDVERSTKTLEDITGKGVTTYRSPAFSFTESNKWVFEILNEFNIEIDCSIFPASRDFGGFSECNIHEPSFLKYNNAMIKELPLNYASIMNKRIIYSGGGYFRFYPYWFLDKLYSQSNYSISYFHPRDFDPQQPKLTGLSKIRNFKGYYGLKNSKSKFNKLLNDFRFVDVEEANSIINWQKVPIYDLN